MLSVKLLPNETFRTLSRQSLWLLTLPLSCILVLALFPFYLLIKYELFFEFSQAIFFWWFGLFIFGFYKYLLWLLTVLIVTDQRLIYVKYTNFFKKQVFDPSLKSISHIVVSSKFPWQFFGIQNLEATIGGATVPLRIENLKNCQQIKNKITNLIV